MKWKLISSLAVSLIGSVVADAQTATLDYQGNDLSGFTQYTAPDGTVTLGDFSPGAVSGELVLDSPLAFNATNQLITPLSWNFDSVGLDSASFAALGAPESTLFSFSTSNGAITGWDMEISFGPQPGTDPAIGGALDSFGPGSGGPGQDLLSSSETGSGGALFVQATSVSAGTWSETVVRAPELDPTSSFSAVAFLAGCLAVLRGRRRRSHA